MAEAVTQANTEDAIDREYRAQSASNRFKQQMSYGVGAAMVFGLFSAGAKFLFDAAAAANIMSAGFLMPAIGLVGLAVVGIGALYLSANLLSRTVLLDQEMQAHKIQQAKQKSQEIAVATPEQEKPAQQFPQGLTDKTEDAAPDTQWTDKFEKRKAPDIAALRATNDDDKSWGDKVKAAPAADKQLAAL